MPFTKQKLCHKEMNEGGHVAKTLGSKLQNKVRMAICLTQ